jgi:hypothetical protein
MSDGVTGDYDKVTVTEIDGRSVILAAGRSSDDLLDAETGAVIASYPRPSRSRADPGHVHFDTQWVAAWGNDAMGFTFHDGPRQWMWSLSKGDAFALPTPGFEVPATSSVLVGSRSSTRLVLGAKDRPVRSFDATGSPVAIFDDSVGGDPCVAVAGSTPSAVLVKAGDEAVVYDVDLGRPLVRIPLESDEGLPPASMRPLAAGVMDGVYWMVGCVSQQSTWLVRHRGSGIAPQRLFSSHAQGAAIVYVSGQQFVAVSRSDRVLLISPLSGALALTVPFGAAVFDVASAGPERLCVAVGGDVLLLHLKEMVRPA